jgi:hypothetical protein
MDVALPGRRATAGRRARTVAGVGAAVAVGTAGLMALAAGTAAADEPGRCHGTVNVRAEPDLAAPVVGVCPGGTAMPDGEMPAPAADRSGIGTASSADRDAAGPENVDSDSVERERLDQDSVDQDSVDQDSVDREDTPRTTPVPDPTPGDA